MSFESSRSKNSAASSGASRKRGRLSASPWSGRGRKPRAESARTPGASSGVSDHASPSFSTRRAPFSDFQSYMMAKNRKLRDQFDADASTSSLGSGDGESRHSDNDDDKGIFHGVSIFVDGYTVPSSQELRACMLKHGGRFENYFSRQTVTHIVCSHLPESKMKNLRSFSRGLPVVKPSWIMDSVTANRLLNWVPYQLEQLLTASHKQQKLFAFFTIKGEVRSNDATNGTSMNVEKKNKLMDSIGCETDKMANLSKCESEGCAETNDLGCQSYCKMRDTEKKSVEMGDEGSITETRQESLQRPSSSIAQHSTLGDPNFVENYFKNSRLHFIGTWRKRYRRLFLNNTPDARQRKLCVSQSGSQKAAIIHVDMDCFFVSVVIRKYPELSDKPVAISHSDNAKGTAEISSANYPAREYGLQAGMFVRDAKVLCPHLTIFPYDFDAYQEVADQFYTILHEHCPKVQAISCDEAFLDATEISDDPEKLASVIRQQIADTTGCTASAGISVNMLMARLATRVAKPNGQFFIPPEKVDEYSKELPVEALPGIGYALKEKLKSHHIKTCAQLRLIPKEILQKDFGKKVGDMLWNYCRGIDHRTVHVVQEMKSVGAEVNWGVRFRNVEECHYFLTSLCKEVSLRLKGAGVRGRTITLKVRKRKKGASEPIKYMGCGECESMSRSMTVPSATDNEEMLTKMSKELFGSFHVEAKDVRGIGLQLSKLESAEIRHEANTLETWIASSSEKTLGQLRKDAEFNEEKKAEPNMVHMTAQCNSEIAGYASHLSNNDPPPCVNQAGDTSWANQFSLLPPIGHLDINVIKSLPPEIIAEMNEIYHGRLSEFIRKHEDRIDQGNDEFSTMPNLENKRAQLSVDKGKRAIYSSDLPSYKTSTKSFHDCSLAWMIMRYVPIFSYVYHLFFSFKTGCSVLKTVSSVGIDRTDLMPSSLSQVDESVLGQLPEEVEMYLRDFLPAHRNSDSFGGPSGSSINESRRQHGIKSTENFDLHLWMGKPPNWVKYFKRSSCLILNSIAEIHADTGMENLLSSTLQSLILSIPSLCSENEEWDDEAVSIGCEFLRQYIELKVDTDIEELYICFRILKRLTKHSLFFSCVYNEVLPSLQGAVCKNYGGMFQLSFAE
ncbi:unnamed protein product [Spirodela intermedia]|uniref:DNA polymerase kappa n=1 Tax=Spirodela intermedia TaxID=51605 RepID=A0A7I8LJB2_SPIIN|nr:unnamed protein product [Spirodela intermedia]